VRRRGEGGEVEHHQIPPHEHTHPFPPLRRLPIHQNTALGLDNKFKWGTETLENSTTQLFAFVWGGGRPCSRLGPCWWHPPDKPINEPPRGIAAFVWLITAELTYSFLILSPKDTWTRSRDEPKTQQQQQQHPMCLALFRGEGHQTQPT
jgi:hypothetical protein